MKIHIEGRRLKVDIEREPMAPYKFYLMWVCIAACVMTLGFFSLLR